MNIITITYKSTNYYFIDTGHGLLAFDAGWPDTLDEYCNCLKKQGYSVNDIKWLVVSHFHLDHAGLCGIMVEQGIELIVFKNQISAIGEMELIIERKGLEYHKLDLSKITIMDISVSRSWLKSIGIEGEVVHTNGHGEHCISLLLDTGIAFIGDLAPENAIADDDLKSKNNWHVLRNNRIKKIMPAHTGEYML
jgi:endoribonuclease LACTB2